MPPLVVPPLVVVDEVAVVDPPVSTAEPVVVVVVVSPVPEAVVVVVLSVVCPSEGFAAGVQAASSKVSAKLIAIIFFIVVYPTIPVRSMPSVKCRCTSA